MTVKQCETCKGTGYWRKPAPGEDVDMRDCCGVCCGVGYVTSRTAGTVVKTVHGEVTLVREMNGQSSVDGWEVRRADGRLAYLTYEDFGMTEAELAEVRKILAQNRVGREAMVTGSVAEGRDVK